MKTTLSVILLFLLGAAFLEAAPPARKPSISITRRDDLLVAVINKVSVPAFKLDIDRLDQIRWPQVAGEMKVLTVTIEMFYDSVGAQDIIEVTVRGYHGEEVSYERHIFLSPKENLPSRPSPKKEEKKEKSEDRPQGEREIA